MISNCFIDWVLCMDGPVIVFTSGVHDNSAVDSGLVVDELLEEVAVVEEVCCNDDVVVDGSACPSVESADAVGEGCVVEFFGILGVCLIAFGGSVDETDIEVVVADDAVGGIFGFVAGDIGVDGVVIDGLSFAVGGWCECIAVVIEDFAEFGGEPKVVEEIAAVSEECETCALFVE